MGVDDLRHPGGVEEGQVFQDEDDGGWPILEHLAKALSQGRSVGSIDFAAQADNYTSVSGGVRSPV